MDEVAHQCVLIWGEQGLLGAKLVRRRVFERIGFAEGRDGGSRTAAIDGNPPSHTSEVRALILSVPPSAIAIELQERLLHRIFRVMGVEQNGVHDAEDETRLPLDELRKVRLSVLGQDALAPGCLRPDCDAAVGKAGSIPCTHARTGMGSGVFDYFRMRGRGVLKFPGIEKARSLPRGAGLLLFVAMVERRVEVREAARAVV